MTVEYRRGNPTILDQIASTDGVQRPSYVFDSTGGYVFSLQLSGVTGDILVTEVDSAGQLTDNVESLSLSASSPTNAAYVNLVLDGTGDYLYVADGGTRLYTIDVSNPLAISEVDVLTVPDQGTAGVLLRLGDTLYLLADGAARFVEIDITTPTAPSVSANISASNTADGCLSGAITPDQARIIYPSDEQLGIISITTAGSPSESTPKTLPSPAGGGTIELAPGGPIFVDVPSNRYLVAVAWATDGISGHVVSFWMAWEKGVSWDTLNLISHDDTGGTIEPLLFDHGNIAVGSPLITQSPRIALLSSKAGSYVYVNVIDIGETELSGSLTTWEGGLVPRLVSSIALPSVAGLRPTVRNASGTVFTQGQNVVNVTDTYNLLAFAEPAGWVDISAYTLNEPGVTVSYGIAGSGPHDRVATTGQLTFQLDNSEFNASSARGAFSPDNTNALAGFVEGQEIRLTVTDSTDFFTWVWRGWIDNIAVIPGAKRERRVAVTCVDAMDALARSRPVNIQLYEDINAHDVFNLLMNYIRPQPVNTSVGFSDDVYAFIFDQSPENRITLLTELQRLAASERGFIYVENNGLLQFEPRNVRAVNVASSVTLDDDDLHMMSPARSRANIINRARATVFPREEDSAPVVLFQASKPIQIFAGQEVTFDAEYKSPDERLALIGSNSINPPAATTDYLFNTAKDGTGTNITHLLKVTVFPGANTAKVTLRSENADTTPGIGGWVTHFQLRGTGLYTLEPITATVEDDISISRHGLMEVTYDLPHHGNPETAKSVAGYLVSSRKEPRTFLDSITLILNNNVALMDDFIKRNVLHISDRITVQETVTGISTDYYVNSVALEITDKRYLKATFGLTPADTERAWLLGTAGYSELGETTTLGSGFFA